MIGIVVKFIEFNRIYKNDRLCVIMVIFEELNMVIF